MYRVMHIHISIIQATIAQPMMSFSMYSGTRVVLYAKLNTVRIHGIFVFTALFPDHRGITVSSEMRQSLMLLHRYIVVKVTTDLPHLFLCLV